MAIYHNKKRNAGMLREFFSMYLAECLVNNNKVKAVVAKNIWKKHISEGSELYKEMKLSRILLESKFTNKAVAEKLLKKVMIASCNINEEKLNKEKTALVREINSSLGLKFFDYELKDYTNLASVHVWLTENIKNKNSNNVLEIEDKVLNYLCEHKEVVNNAAANTLLETKEKTVDGLVVKIMHDKLNEKYSGVLSEDQKKILQQHVFGKNKKELNETLENLRDETIFLIEKELHKNKSKKEQNELTEIKKLLREDYYDVTNTTDTNIIFYLTISKLNDDLKDTKDE